MWALKLAFFVTCSAHNIQILLEFSIILVMINGIADSFHFNSMSEWTRRVCQVCHVNNIPKTILYATCATGFVVCVVQFWWYIENVLFYRSVVYGKEKIFLFVVIMSFYIETIDRYIYSLVGYELNLDSI